MHSNEQIHEKNYSTESCSEKLQETRALSSMLLDKYLQAKESNKGTEKTTPNQTLSSQQTYEFFTAEASKTEIADKPAILAVQ